jgi:hypothetical protein
MIPSFGALFITGLLMLSIVVIFFRNYDKFMKVNFITKIMVLGIITIAIGVHGLIHLGLETAYNFNPYNYVF